MLQRWSGAQGRASRCRRTPGTRDGRGGRSIADFVLDSEDMPVVIALKRRKSVSTYMQYRSVFSEAYRMKWFERLIPGVVTSDLRESLKETSRW